MTPTTRGKVVVSCPVLFLYTVSVLSFDGVPEQWLGTNIQFSDFSHGSTFCLDGISLGIWIYLDLLNRPGRQLQCHLE